MNHRCSLYGAAALFFSGAMLLGACVGTDAASFEDDNRNDYLDGLDDDTGEPTGPGGGGACQTGQQQSCYSGPEGTAGVGVCLAGTQTCDDAGVWGACLGEVLPQAEVCATQGDDDCDGLTNEDGPDCACDPGSTVECYSGPPSTKNQGICQAGTQACNDNGIGYGPCTGEVLPAVEDCGTPADEDCDGQTPPCPDGVIVDLRGDNNRNGTVELTAASEDANENTWDESHGAVFLANLDDDENACPTSGSDTQLAACSDANDNYVNGNDDLADLARLETVPWPNAPSDASGYVSLSAPGSSYVRLFKKSGSSWSEYQPGSVLGASELQSGIEFAVEGTDFVRDSAVWDGFVDVNFVVNGGTDSNGPVGTVNDTLRMRVAPVIFRHHLDELETYYVTAFNYQSSLDFRGDLEDAANAAGVPNPVKNIYESDQWTEDFFETAYMSMPTSSGQHAMHINFRSANHTGGALRTAGRVVFTDLRGEDVAGAVHYDTNHNNSMDTLNSFGNFETIPPFSKGGQSWPLGRVLRGSHPQFYPDQAFDKMVNSQGVQDSVYIDTSWLLVGHVDETVSFIKANNNLGWVMLANDAAMAKSMLEDAQDDGFGNTSMFVGKYWDQNTSAQISINAVLADDDIMTESAKAVAYVDSQVDVIKQATGITDADIVPIPFLHWETSGWSVAFQPGTVNGIYMADDVFAAPDPHGPTIGGVDIFKDQMSDSLGNYGVAVEWIENWDLYHRLLGEVHCGSNATRKIPSNTFWWESGL